MPVALADDPALQALVVAEQFLDVHAALDGRRLDRLGERTRLQLAARVDGDLRDHQLLARQRVPAVHQQPRLVLVDALPDDQSDVGEAAADPLQITRLTKAVVNLRVGLLLTLLLVLLVLPGRIRTARSAGTYLV
ncbi:hypothetical protein [Streptomyces althioticus]|uniref:hypothetical protein n=1 Tax=Streptomyces althioticus TaxID=83380 RepID=UPI003EB80295